jgi:IclR family acetate operon transcriptional repressor
VLTRTVLLLDAFGADDETLSLSELASRTGIPRPTVHRMLAQLEIVRYVERDGHEYRLGMRLFELGQRSPRSRDLREAALPFLGDLRDATHETVHFAVLDGSEVVYLEKLVGHHGPHLASRVGGRLPANCTGVGKALLAFSAPGLVDALLLQDLPRLTPRSIHMPGLLQRELAKVRREGVAFEYEESTKGVVCVASPVMGPDGHAVAALSVSGWRARCDPVRFAPAVRTAALAVSRHLDETERSGVRLPREGSPSRAR